MKIFRIQDQYGRGPFKPGFTKNWLIYSKKKDELLPWYHGKNIEEIKSILPENNLFGTGCRSINCLRKWFTKKEYKKLVGYGYSSVYIEISDDEILVEDKNQILFKRDVNLNNGVKKFVLYQ